MANIQANIKRHNQDVKKHVQIHSQLSAMKTQIKKTQKTKSKKDLTLAYKIIDSSLSKGIIKKNKADRLKSRLALFVNDDKRFVAVETKKVYKKNITKPETKKTANTSNLKATKPKTEKTASTNDSKVVKTEVKKTANSSSSKTSKPKTNTSKKENTKK